MQGKQTGETPVPLFFKHALRTTRLAGRLALHSRALHCYFATTSSGNANTAPLLALVTSRQ